MVMTTINKMMNILQSPAAKSRRGIPVRLRPTKTSRTKTQPQTFKMFTRRLKYPSGGNKPMKYLYTSYTDHVKSGTFQQDFYTQLRSGAKFRSIRHAIRFHYTFFFMAALTIVGIYLYDGYLNGPTAQLPIDLIGIMIVWGLIAALMVKRRVNDEFAFYNARTIVDKHNLNTVALNLYHTVPHVFKHQELSVIETFRKRYNKYILFPSTEERHVFVQMDGKNKRGYHADVNINDMKRYRKHFTQAQIKREHEAARQIAELKQEMSGGKNEYDEMVKKYADRMDPALKHHVGLSDK